MTVNKPAMRLWVEDLRTTTERQGVGTLRSLFADGSSAYCCLGRACEVAIRSGAVSLLWDGSGAPGRYVNPMPIGGRTWEAAILPGSVADWLGVDQNPVIAVDDDTYEAFELRAATANDNKRWTFHQIADAIESYYNLLED